MTRGLLLQVHKEIRALLPWWLGIVGCLAVSWGLQDSGLNDVVILRLQTLSSAAYAFGAVSLGALSIGHEFSNRTLAGLLAHPVSRYRLFVTKGAVLALLLATLAVVASNIFPAFPQWRGVATRSWVFWLPLVCGISLSPWLTMISRGQLAGAVFATALPVAALVLGGYLRLPRIVIFGGIGAAGAVSGYLAWRTFRRLEAIGDRQTEVELVPWRSHNGAHILGRRRSCWTLLISKELQLQQMTLVLAGIFTSLWMAAWLVSSLAADLIPLETRYAITMLYGVLVSIMAGALASAEERRLGTLDSSLLLPFSNRAQWQIKAWMAIGLSVLLAFVLPAMLQLVAPDPTINELFNPFLAGGLCIVALYMSSLSSSGVHATLATVPAMAVAGAVALLASWPLLYSFGPGIQALAEWVAPSLNITAPDWRWSRYSINAGCGIGAVMMLVFAGANHQLADRSSIRVVKHLAILAGIALASVLAMLLIQAVLMEWRRLALAALATASGR